MKRKLCGDISVNPMGFGGIPIQRVSQKEASEILHLCLDKGIDFIDTARVYTDSEEKIGNAISLRKKEFFIATKSIDRTKEGMLKDINISLKNLKIDNIDLYQVHNIGSQADINAIMAKEGAMQALQEAKETGIISHIGVTSHKPELINETMDNFDTIQVPFNIIESQFLKTIERANELGIGTIIMKPLAGGAFKNAVSAMKWLLNYDVSVIIPGMQSIKEVNENTKLAQNYKLTDEEKEKLNKEAEAMDKNICRRCEYCNRVCPEGIDITKSLMFDGYFKRYNLKEWAKERYDSVVNEKPDKCIECGKCEEACPYDLPIRSLLKQVVKDFK